jgi:uncharacterized BrkB/YihY/UPF0761 family membrane protein
METHNVDQKKTAMPIVAGILLVVSAGIKVLVLFGLLIAATFVAFPGDFPRIGALLGVFILVPAIIIIALELAGGILSLQRKRWGWALAGAIVSILPFSFLGIAATILVALSRNEFGAA